MRAIPVSLIAVLLTACGGGPPSGNSAIARAAASGTCPSPDPVRDGPLVDAIRSGDRGAVDAVLAVTPSDTRALAALAVISRRGALDQNEAACFAPYLT